MQGAVILKYNHYRLILVVFTYLLQAYSPLLVELVDLILQHSLAVPLYYTHDIPPGLVAGSFLVSMALKPGLGRDGWPEAAPPH